MRSGREVLGDIDQSVERLRAQIGRQSQQITVQNQQLADTRHDQNETYRELAEIRLELIEGGDLTKEMTRTDQKAQEILVKRVQKAHSLELALEKNHTQQREYEAMRFAALKSHEVFAAKVEKAEAKTHKWLSKEEGWSEQEAALEKADAIAQRAADKTRVAQEDAHEKNAPYHADPLFMYLWQRHYGTSDYHANPLARLLDGWVARLIDYEPARINYTMLNDLPVRLQEHAEHKKTLAQAEAEKLETLEQKAFERDGVLLLQNELSEKAATIAELDEKIAEAEKAHQELTEQLANFSEQKDPLYQEAISLLTDFYEREDVFHLLRDAEHTETPADNRVVERLMRLKGQLAQIENNAQEQATILRRMHQRLDELQQARHQFKKRHYDGYDVMFQNPELITLLLEQVLAGSFDAGRLLKQLADLYVFRPRPRYRKRHRGGFSFPHTGGSWGGNSGGFRLPSGGGGRRSGGGGGFRTGGGF